MPTLPEFNFDIDEVMTMIALTARTDLDSLNAEHSKATVLKCRSAVAARKIVLYVNLDR